MNISNGFAIHKSTNLTAFIALPIPPTYDCLSQAEKPDSIAWRIADVLNLKLLRLLPGTVSWGCSTSGFFLLLSVVVVVVVVVAVPFPPTLVLAFHTQSAIQRDIKSDSFYESLLKKREDVKPLRGLSGLRATRGGCFDIHDFKDLHMFVISNVMHQITKITQ